jgi:hypothetical protein
VVGIEQHRKQETEHQGQLQQGDDEHDRGDGERGIEKSLDYGDEQPRVDEPAGIPAARLHG